MITCPLCNKQFKQLTITHLKSAHKLTMENFDILYPNFKKQNEKIYHHQKKSLEVIETYNKNPKLCLHCNKPIEYKKRTNTFCDSSCGASYSNKGRKMNEKTKNKISTTLSNGYCKIYYNTCSHCKNIFVTKRKGKKTCSTECNHMIQIATFAETCVEGGKKSAATQVRRSKKEVDLFELLNNEYDCIHNKPIFNGWDADIIIPSLKLAILWNGPWHYTKVMKGHSYKQTLNRDLIKLSEIQKNGFGYILVKDYKNKMTPDYAFNVIQEFINKKISNVTII